MIQAGDNLQTSEQGWLDSYDVFFDRTFSAAFCRAERASGGDKALAAQRCAHAFGRAYSRWAVLGRMGGAESFVARRIEGRRPKRVATQPPTIDQGVSYKRWVYVASVETGASRQRAGWLLSAASAAVVVVALTVGAMGAGSSENDGRISTTETSPVISTTIPVTSTTAPRNSTTTSTAPPRTTRSADAPDVPGEQQLPDRFTLNLTDLPTSPIGDTNR